MTRRRLCNFFFFLLQLLVQAVNQGVAVQTATSTVNIQVTRNENAPVFPLSPYSVTVEDTKPLGSNITQVSATDADNVSIVKTP